MRPLVIGGEVWMLRPCDPEDPRLVDRTGSARLATTDPATRCVYFDRRLRGRDLATVLTHEAGHCAMWSYGLLGSLRRLIPVDSWIDVEEWACNFLADHGPEVLQAVRESLGVHPGVEAADA